MGEGVKVVRRPTETTSKQGLGYFIGISEATAGAKGISMNLVMAPAGGAALPHRHQGFETAIYYYSLRWCKGAGLV